MLFVLHVHVGHFEQDAATYAEWGVECEFMHITIIIMVMLAWSTFHRCKDGLV